MAARTIATILKANTRGITPASRPAPREPFGSSRVKSFTPAVARATSNVKRFDPTAFIRRVPASNPMVGMLGDDYTDWTTQTKSIGAQAVTWPFKTGPYASYYGRPAAKFTAQAYTDAYNAGLVSAGAVTQANPTNQYIYVLAGDNVAAAAPPTMNAIQKIENALFTGGDAAANSLGLPSLGGIGDFLNSIGKKGLLIGGGLAAVYVFSRRR